MAEAGLTFRYHRAVQQELNEALFHYEQESGAALADAFYEEFQKLRAKALANPHRFHFEVRGKRRANFGRFPYHFLFTIRRDHLYMFVLRHDKRHPSYGLKRR
jgi:plasmid stabilization system protein ParE